jgi:hypothetical protein
VPVREGAAFLCLCVGGQHEERMAGSCVGGYLCGSNRTSQRSSLILDLGLSPPAIMGKTDKKNANIPNRAFT